MLVIGYRWHRMEVGATCAARFCARLWTSTAQDGVWERLKSIR